MSTYASQKGNDYEHTLGDLVYDRTDGMLVPMAAGYTSRHGDPVDLLVDDGEAVHCFELKRTKHDAFSFIYDKGGNDDIYGLMKFCHDYPRKTYPYLGIRFNSRQLILIKLWVNDVGSVDDTLQTAVQACPVPSKQTHKNNLRVYKPDTDEWSSQQKGDDAQYLLESIGFTL